MGAAKEAGRGKSVLLGDVVGKRPVAAGPGGRCGRGRDFTLPLLPLGALPVAPLGAGVGAAEVADVP